MSARSCAPAPRGAHAHQGARDPQKSRGLLRQAGQRDPAVIFGFIAAKKAEHSTKTMCRVLDVSRSRFHAWERRAPSVRRVADERLPALRPPEISDCTSAAATAAKSSGTQMPSL